MDLSVLRKDFFKFYGLEAYIKNILFAKLQSILVKHIVYHYSELFKLNILNLITIYQKKSQINNELNINKNKVIIEIIKIMTI